MKNYETYNDSLLSPHNPNGEGYTEESELEETDYDNPDPPEEEEKTDLTTMLFKQILTSF
jgi:hypothetical protein